MSDSDATLSQLPSPTCIQRIGPMGDKLNSAFETSVKPFYASLNWDALSASLVSLRGGIPCLFSKNYSVVRCYIWRALRFKDGLTWVARVRLPSLGKGFDGMQMLDVASIIRVEVSSMMFIKANTDIPVPMVHLYDVSFENELGAPYIIVDYIRGAVAAEQAARTEGSPHRFGSQHQDQAFKRQMARIQATLASLSFPQIGSLYYDDTRGMYFIGPEPETGRGPWMTATDYFNDAVEHALKSCASKAADPEVCTSSSFANPLLYKHIISYWSRLFEKGPFRLVNRSLGAHSVLVDDDFNITGVLDFDGVMSAPWEVVAQFPMSTGLDPYPPGYEKTGAAAVEAVSSRVGELKQYWGLVQDEEEVLTGVTHDKWSDAMFSRAAYLFYGLQTYNRHDKLLNDSWMTAYLNIMRFIINENRVSETYTMS